MKMSKAPKGATHWQPKTEFTRECFYKKVPSGVSRYIVAPEDGRCNEWSSAEGRGEVSVIEVLPIELINNHDRMVEEIAELREFACSLQLDVGNEIKLENLLAKLNQEGEE